MEICELRLSEMNKINEKKDEAVVRREGFYKARARLSRVRQGDDVKDADNHRTRISPGRC